jgi:nitrogen-specific signal transduction histidine kinase/tetratricopeptide (TPR) repeat protein
MFLSITSVLAAALGWLGWQLLQQERELSRQRIQERVEAAADLITAALHKDLSELEQKLTDLANMSREGLAGEATGFARSLPGDSVLLLFDAGGVESLPGDRLLFHPYLPPAQEPPRELFSAAETLEFQRQDYGGAILALRKPANAADPQVRAAAWTRLGRNYRKSGRWEEAVRAYGELRGLGQVTVSGLPAELLARDALCSLLGERGDAKRLQEEASAFYADVGRARWKIGEAAYTYYAGQARQRMGASAVDSTRADALSLSEAAQVLWGEWQRIRPGETTAGGRRGQRFASRPVLLVWRSSGDRLAALAGGAAFLESAWLRALDPVLVNHGARLTLTDADGQPAWGNPTAENNRASVRLASTTRLPWTVQTSAVPNPAMDDNQTVRRRLLVVGFCLMVLLVVSGSYFIGRAATKEIRVAQQQSDFVAAVSHEFRTPLTSLCQFTELLAKGRVTSEEDRQRFYGVVARESQRLRRLVEGLLNFGRLEAGVLDYRFEKLDPAVLVGQVVAEFEEEGNGREHRIEWSACGSLPPVRADREALGCVIWNLLDNAIKYSPDQPAVRIRIGRADGCVTIAVRDEGIGIAHAEQDGIFKKFTRGAAAKTLHVRGTGIGLSMARQIIHDHGGEITLDSEPGKGSTFTVFLPVVEQS